MTTPFDRLPTQEQAEQQAARRTARLKAEAGMFADHVEPVTAEQIIQAAREHRDRFQRTMDALQAKGDAATAELSVLVSPEALAELDRRRATLPDESEFHADFWCRNLNRV